VGPSKLSLTKRILVLAIIVYGIFLVALGTYTTTCHTNGSGCTPPPVDLGFSPLWLFIPEIVLILGLGLSLVLSRPTKGKNLTNDRADTNLLGKP